MQYILWKSSAIFNVPAKFEIYTMETQYTYVFLFYVAL